MSEMILVEQAAPATPATGKVAVYVNTSGQLCLKDDAAAVFILSTDILPVVDTTALVKGSADATKLVRLEVDGLTTGTTRVITVPDADLTLVGLALTQTLTNKRVTARVSSEASSATPTINTDNADIHRITALALDITSMSTNLTGTPVHGDCLLIEITGTAARAITWGASFEASTVALPTTTVTTAMLSVSFLYNSATSKWRCIGAV